MSVRLAFRYAILSLVIPAHSSSSFAQVRHNTVPRLRQVDATDSINGAYAAAGTTPLNAAGRQDLHSSAKEGNAEQNNKLVPTYGDTAGGPLD